MDRFIEVVAPELSSKVHEVAGLLWRSGKNPESLRNLADDDPCPCDRPGTLWETCHKWTDQLVRVRTPLPEVPSSRSVDSQEPYDPDSAASGSKELASEDTPPDLEGPVIYTFTFRLPFALGLLDDVGEHRSYFSDRYVDPVAAAHFGEPPYVRMRLRNVPDEHTDLWPEKADQALEWLYPEGQRQDTRPRLKLPGAYEQWVTLETPGALLRSEDLEDRAYAFHRCLSALNVFLLSHDVVYSYPAVHPVSTQEIGPIVIRGAILETGRWIELGPLWMHPESWPDWATPGEVLHDRLGAANRDLRNGRPFMMTRAWHRRGLRAFRYRGDHADCILSLQIAAEVMMYDLWRMLLIDRGKRSGEINQRVRDEVPYRSVLTREIPALLGGSWDVTRPESEVGGYWNNVYLPRCRIVHSGLQPSSRDAEAAMAAFDKVREYINVLLSRRLREYLRTAVAKMGTAGLERRGWLTPSVRDLATALVAEPSPYFWPADVAGR